MTYRRSQHCATILTSIARYLDGELPATACREIEDHCRECPNCANVVAGLRETIGLCRAAGRKPLPAAVRRRATARVRLLLKNERSGRARRR